MKRGGYCDVTAGNNVKAFIVSAGTQRTRRYTAQMGILTTLCEPILIERLNTTDNIRNFEQKFRNVYQEAFFYYLISA